MTVSKNCQQFYIENETSNEDKTKSTTSIDYEDNFSSFGIGNKCNCQQVENHGGHKPKRTIGSKDTPSKDSVENVMNIHCEKLYSNCKPSNCINIKGDCEDVYYKQLMNEVGQSQKKEEKRSTKRKQLFKISMVVVILIALTIPIVICFGVYRHIHIQENHKDFQPSNEFQSINASQFTDNKKDRFNRVTFELDFHDSRFEDTSASLNVTKWTTKDNILVDFNNRNNQFSVRKPGLYFISLSLNVGTYVTRKLTKSLVCIRYGSGTHERCNRVVLTENIDIPIYIQEIHYLFTGDTFWISFTNKNILYRSSTMNTLTVWKM
ncbi:unnamed protein product [Mytilus coruscus]|uniref:Uncharacterized protein n=1 Tax=Mytilus coruscus TaxID=42192 RepID=A0A6J8CMV8_MYTCO|nr:unnamed protein product [Mytilus coruscus]